MIAIKAINTTFFNLRDHKIFNKSKLPSSKNCSITCLCKSKNESESDSDSGSSSNEGDTRRQELLAKIAMLQAQKVRLTDYLDERSAFLTQFAEEANAEFDKVGEDALKDLDEASARITEYIDSKMQAFEESREVSRQEIEKNENIISEFENQIVRDKNEGLFFKNLAQKPSSAFDKKEAKKEADKIKDLTKEKAGSKTRKTIYVALIGVMVVVIADSFLTTPDWRKVAVFGGILVGLVTQYSYEQRLSAELERKEREQEQNSKK